MPNFISQKIVAVLALCLLLIISVFTNFPGQNLQISPTSSPSPSPSPLTTRTPAPKPTASPVPGAQNFHQWGSITLFNGLPSDSVRAVAQTPDGVMWFGTDNGLARFDGRRVQNFSFGGSEADHVLALKTASTGKLWIGTQKGAFVYWENQFQTIVGTEDVGIAAILLADETFLGTDTGFVLRVKANEDGILSAEGMFPAPVLGDDGNPIGITSLVRANGELMAGTLGRGVLLVRERGFSEFQTNPRPIFVNSVARDVAGDLWFGTDAAKGLSGLYSIENGSSARRIAAPTANVVALEADQNGLWAGTERYGLFRALNSKVTKTYTFENTSGGLRSDTIYSLFTDREGVLWIGTNRGVSRFDPAGAIQETVSDIPNSNFVRTFSRMGDVQSYAGTNRGLFVKVKGGTWTEVPALKNKVIYAIADGTGGKMIIGTSEGVFDITGKKLFDGDVRGFASLGSRQFAAIYGRGVVDITGSDPQTVFADETVTSVCNVLGNRFWIGTAGHGLFSFDGKRAKSEAGPDVLKSGAIWNMFDTPEGTLYIAGQHGVSSFGNGNAEQIIAAEEVRDVFSHDGQVWAATTTRGLLHARQDDRFGWLVSSIGFEQGMPSEKAFLIRPNGDGLTIGTNRGVVWYRSGTVAPKLIATRVLSQRLHEPNEIGSTIELDYPQNSLQIEVAGQSSRTFPEEFQYAFLLKDSRGEIIDSRLSNEAGYSPAGLTPGSYSVESVAYDRDLLSSEPLAIHFSIARAPFPWTAAALGILLVIAVIAFVWAMIERRRIALSNSELAAARFDLANEAERERSRIARDLHDQTLADLRNLMMTSDRLAPGNSEFRSEIESVSTEIRRICEDLSPSVLENVGLVPALEFLLGRSVGNHKFSTSEDANELVRFPLIVQLHIYRIAQEIVTNIDRHSDADLVEMSVKVFVDERFVLTIRDNGKPFQPVAAVSKGRGISNVRSRASLINAKIDWKQHPDGGNLFSLEIAGKSSV